MVSTCSSGGIFFWRGNFKDAGYSLTEEVLPEQQYYDNSNILTKVYYDWEYKCLISLTTYSSLWISTNFGKTFYYEFLTPLEQKLTCLAFSKQNNLILLGNKNGQLIVYNWPLFEKEELNGSF